ncbi:MAG: HNH endonuclease [Planctomycetaceae bacterium]|nr:HNH endonuclease [Planctomycetaceae bacterium]
MCPICRKGFDHTEIEYLQGDHIWPYSLFGESSWANYQLICGSCNARKRDFVEHAIRLVLGDGSFRRIVCGHLEEAVAAGKLTPGEMAILLIDRAQAEIDAEIDKE